ncbi:hypothetical protein [Thalassospira xiamenensis]|uniref:DNA-binding protein n=1 Tax=Thalassospira xiamenensis TaxID=220697 RepID=A0A367X8P0_9PROT|nr:hypothetical protein [Thalassospira xiamenensis]KZB56383.1 DNA-binding protein [Thalassospira xiamenensis]MCK2167167.1 DNA-binding protein [Thalassospira xiamenensis]RCK50023.1 DNA-binding protein [Thalassospira xiamenensis]
MTISSSLTNDETPLVLDTSVLINLHACSYGERILSALPHGLVVPQVVANELEHETSKTNGEQGFLKDLVIAGKVEIATMNDAEYALYARLITGTPSLDDGEAATIAIATARGFCAVIDERKGRAKFSELCSEAVAGWSLDLMLHPHVRRSLGSTTSVDAVYMALRDGRMRIAEEHCDHVVSLIGSYRAVDCTCLPGYRRRSGQWMSDR